MAVGPDEVGKASLREPPAQLVRGRAVVSGETRAVELDRPSPFDEAPESSRVGENCLRALRMGQDRPHAELLRVLGNGMRLVDIARERKLDEHGRDVDVLERISRQILVEQRDGRGQLEAES